jgi:hypothetical protein
VLSDYDMILALENSIIPVMGLLAFQLAWGLKFEYLFNTGDVELELCCVPLVQHYVTEKLYDALLSHSIPVYIGAPNVLIDAYIRRDCGVFPVEFASIQTNHATKSLSMNYSAIVDRYYVLGLQAECTV